MYQKKFIPNVKFLIENVFFIISLGVEITPTSNLESGDLEEFLKKQ